MKTLNLKSQMVKKVAGVFFIFVFIILIKIMMEGNDGQKEDEQNVAPVSVGVI